MTTEPTRRCVKCRRTMKASYSSPVEAETIHQAHGLCGRDYAAWVRSGRPELEYDEAPALVVVPDGALVGFLTARRRRGVPATGLAVAS